MPMTLAVGDVPVIRPHLRRCPRAASSSAIATSRHGAVTSPSRWQPPDMSITLPLHARDNGRLGRWPSAGRRLWPVRKRPAGAASL